jgi:hypothetical protein
MDVVEELVRAFVLPTVLAAESARAMDQYPSAWGMACDPAYPQILAPGMVPAGAPIPVDSRWVQNDGQSRPIEQPQAHPQAHPQMHPQMRPQYPGYPPPPMEHPHQPREQVAPGEPAPRGAPRPIARQEDAHVEIFQSPAPPRGSRGTITVSGMSSPIGGVPNEAWSEFVGRIAREQVTFTSPHHVGQFRQRRSRLAELGIDPGSVVGSPDAQASALCADMGDAYRHAVESGLVAEYQGVAVEIPASGQANPIEVTLSGVMGVIQAAGLEGAAGWLEDAEDRRRFPHTTQAFLRTNGVF